MSIENIIMQHNLFSLFILEAVFTENGDGQDFTRGEVLHAVI